MLELLEVLDVYQWALVLLLAASVLLAWSEVSAALGGDRERLARLEEHGVLRRAP